MLYIINNKLKRGKYNLSTRINNLKLVCEQDNYITIANNELLVVLQKKKIYL